VLYSARAVLSGGVIVELLYTEGCPHAAAYLPHLRQLVADAGLGEEPVRTQLITDAEQAQRERFLGSPTIRVAGVDVDTGAEGRLDYGLTCRLYVTPDGLRGHPEDAWVLSDLRLRQRLDRRR
jgi:hypothetical protein